MAWNDNLHVALECIFQTRRLASCKDADDWYWIRFCNLLYARDTDDAVLDAESKMLEQYETQGTNSDHAKISRGAIRGTTPIIEIHEEKAVRNEAQSLSSRKNSFGSFVLEKLQSVSGKEHQLERTRSLSEVLEMLVSTCDAG